MTSGCPFTAAAVQQSFDARHGFLAELSDNDDNNDHDDNDDHRCLHFDGCPSPRFLMDDDRVLHVAGSRSHRLALYTRTQKNGRTPSSLRGDVIVINQARDM